MFRWTPNIGTTASLVVWRGQRRSLSLLATNASSQATTRHCRTSRFALYHHPPRTGRTLTTTGLCRSPSSSSSVSEGEIHHFDALAATWWDLHGSSALLHKMNPARIGFIKSHVTAGMFPSDLERVGHRWLEGQRTLDVGCGGGILSESLARLGATVTGVDASVNGIRVAREHARQMGIEGIEYLHTSAESLLVMGRGSGDHSDAVEGPDGGTATRRESFDVVCAMEVLEHVSSPPKFLETVMTLLKPGGLLFVSTIEKTRFAELLTCTIAEDILRLVPKGTHSYDKFVPKRAMHAWVGALGGRVVDTRGIIFDPLAGTWRVLSRGQTWGEACNYIMAIRKD